MKKINLILENIPKDLPPGTYTATIRQVTETDDHNFAVTALFEPAEPAEPVEREINSVADHIVDCVECYGSYELRELIQDANGRVPVWSNVPITPALIYDALNGLLREGVIKFSNETSVPTLIKR